MLYAHVCAHVVDEKHTQANQCAPHTDISVLLSSRSRRRCPHHIGALLRIALAYRSTQTASSVVKKLDTLLPTYPCNKSSSSRGDGVLNYIQEHTHTYVKNVCVVCACMYAHAGKTHTQNTRLTACAVIIIKHHHHQRVCLCLGHCIGRRLHRAMDTLQPSCAISPPHHTEYLHLPEIYDTCTLSWAFVSLESTTTKRVVHHIKVSFHPQLYRERTCFQDTPCKMICPQTSHHLASLSKPHVLSTYYLSTVLWPYIRAPHDHPCFFFLFGPERDVRALLL